MTDSEIDNYLAALDETKRSTLLDVRGTILEVVPDAEQGMSYGVPAFRTGGKLVAGFAAFKGHLSYFPHSGSVLDRLAGDLADYTWSKGALRFPVDQPLPKALIAKLIAARLAEIAQ